MLVFTVKSAKWSSNDQCQCQYSASALSGNTRILAHSRSMFFMTKKHQGQNSPPPSRPKRYSRMFPSTKLIYESPPKFPGQFHNFGENNVWYFGKFCHFYPILDSYKLSKGENLKNLPSKNLDLQTEVCFNPKMDPCKNRF